MSGRTFYTAAVAIAGGIFVRSVFDIGNIFAYTLLVIGCALLVLWRTRSGVPDKTGGERQNETLKTRVGEITQEETKRKAPPSRVFVFSLACIFVALGMLRFDISTWNESDPLFENHLEKQVTIEGVIREEVDEREKTARLIVHTESIDGMPADRRILVITDRFPSFEYGDRVKVEGTLARPEVFETDLGRTFDYPGYLSVRGITYTIQRAKVEKIGGGEGNKIFASLLAVKHAFMDRLELLLPEPQAGLAEGLVLGAKRALGKSLENAFRDCGVIHIIVLSGYNVTIVAEAVMRLFFFLRPRARAAFGGAGIIAFALIAGLSASVLRASIMAALVLVARATGRKYDILRTLIFAGLVMLLFNPKLLVFDPGFQLSFLATLGLIVVSPLIEKKLLRVPTRFQIREFLTSTMATQVLVLPLLLYSTGIFSVVALLVNVLVLPVVPLTMLLVFLSAMVGFLSHAIALPVAFGAHLLLSYIIGIVEHFATLPFAAFSVPSFPFWIVAVVYGLIAIVLWRLHRSASRQQTS